MLTFKEYSTQNINEGVNDPAIFKAVILAGGPGSGKTFMTQQSGLSSMGFRMVASDAPFERALAKAGLEMTKEVIFSDKGQVARQHAKKVTQKTLEMYLRGRLGIAIDGTAKNLIKVSNQKDKLQDLGYDVAMIFVNTDLPTAIARDAQRVKEGGRSLGADNVTKMWHAAQKNLGLYQKMFGRHFYIVDNSNTSNYKKNSTIIYKKIRSWANTPPKSPVAKGWIAQEKQSKGSTADFKIIAPKA